MFNRSERITNLNFLISQVKFHLNQSSQFNALVHEVEADIGVCPVYKVPVLDITLREKRQGGKGVRHTSIAVRLDYDTGRYTLGHYDQTFRYLNSDDPIPADKVGKTIIDYLFQHLDNRE